MAAEDWSSVKTLMLGEMLAIGTRSQPAVVESWLARVPVDVLTTPYFGMLQAFVLLHAGHVADGRLAIDRAHAGIAEAKAASVEPELPELEALLHVLSAGIGRLECDLPVTTAHAQAVADSLAATGATDTPLGRMALAAARNSLIGVAYWHGDQPGTDLLIETADDTAPDLIRMRINRMSLEASALADAGQIRRADVAIAEVLELARHAGLSSLFQTNPAHLAAGLVALQRGEHARAHEEFTLVWDRGRRHGDRAPATTAGVLLARLSALTGDASSALAMLDQAKTAWPGWTLPPTLAAMIADEEARLCIAGGDLAAARAVLTRIEESLGDAPRRNFSIQLTTARLLLAEGQEDAAAMLVDAAEVALANGKIGRGVEVLVEAAVATRATGQLGNAQVLLGRALELAELETIVAPFLWHAAAVRPLLLSLELGGTQVAMLGFRQRLLDSMGVPAQRSGQAAPAGAAADALSERELTVLRLLRGSLTNPQIAAALQISPNTLKTHLRHIYGKLGADNRQLAIARARELNLF